MTMFCPVCKATPCLTTCKLASRPCDDCPTLFDCEAGGCKKRHYAMPKPHDKNDETSLAVMVRFVNGARDEFARTGGFSFKGESAAYWIAKFASVQADLASLPSAVCAQVPTDDQLSRLFAGYRHYVTDRAPASHLGELHARQRTAWESVFGHSSAIRDKS